MPNIDHAMALPDGISLDDELGVFFTDQNPIVTDLGTVQQIPIGTVLLQRMPDNTTGLWQRFGPNAIDYRKVVWDTGTVSEWGTNSKLISVSWSSASVGRNDWVGVLGAAPSALAGYVFPFDVTIREIIVLISSCTSSSQALHLEVSDQASFEIYVFPKQATEAIYMVSGLNIHVPATKKIRLRGGPVLRGFLKDVNANMFLERVFA